MLKSWMHDLALAIRARSGLTAAFFVWLAVVMLASLTAFAFLCVAAYVWVSLQLGAIYGALAMAGLFVLIGLIGALASAMARRRAKQRAILQRAARAQQTSWLDPKILSVAMEAGRALGWQRIIPIALIGLLAAQWLRERREPPPEDPA
jgi:hypothetical protein